MRCGHCRNSHDSVAEVRACATGAGVLTEARDDTKAQNDDVAARKAHSASEAAANLPTYANANRMAEGIPAGRYAVTEQGVVKFYKVDKGTQGRWAGKTFLKILASDNEHPIKSAARQMSTYAAILKVGVAEASRAYGRELGHCGVCGRALTDPESIAKGIGPVCEAKMGW